jgi:phosphatidylglycerophosphatase A
LCGGWWGFFSPYARVFDAKVVMLRSVITLGPVGFTAIPGTWASLIVMSVFLGISRIVVLSPLVMSVCALGITLGAFALLQSFKKIHDDRSIVIDEVAGMSWALIGATAPADFFAAFLLFRLFDITKFAGVALWERLPGAWGIMADDLWAAVVTLLILHAIPLLNTLAAS